MCSIKLKISFIQSCFIPADPNFAFCGRRATDGPYCAEHAKIAFQPARKRER
ncbi:MAG: GcrA family cell cycle regulator, partial [Cyanobacteria bacterium P01_H01_bin.35]